MTIDSIFGLERFFPVKEPEEEENAPVCVRLGITKNHYFGIAKNIARMKLISLDGREKILEDANEKLKKYSEKDIQELLEHMAHDREVYRIAGLKYWKGPPKGEELFITAIADYFLRNKLA